MINIVESRNDFGTMNTGTIRFSNLTDSDKKMLCDKYNLSLIDLENYDLTKDKKDIFNKHRDEFGKSMGFDGKKMFMADQKHGVGTFFEIDRDYVEANPNGWTDIDEDILVITKKTPGVVIGHPVADCPVVMMTDRKQGISIIGHCSAKLIDKGLPTMIAAVLRSAYGSKTDDIMAYVSACAGEDWTYTQFPEWAKDRYLWDRCIVYGDDDKFHINLKPAILIQIISMGINKYNIVFNMDNTISDPHYYSHSASSSAGGNKRDKFGRNFAGMFFDEKDDDSIEIKKGK